MEERNFKMKKNRTKEKKAAAERRRRERKICRYLDKASWLLLESVADETEEDGKDIRANAGKMELCIIHATQYTRDVFAALEKKEEENSDVRE